MTTRTITTLQSNQVVRSSGAQRLWDFNMTPVLTYALLCKMLVLLGSENTLQGRFPRNKEVF